MEKNFLDDFKNDQDVIALISDLTDNSLHKLMTNLAGHDLKSLLKFFPHLRKVESLFVLFVTLKGFGLPLAGHKDNHSGIMNKQQFNIIKDP